MLEIEPGSYGRAASALNCQASSPASVNSFCKHYSTGIVRYRDTKKIKQERGHWPVIPVLGKAKHENYSSRTVWGTKPDPDVKKIKRP